MFKIFKKQKKDGVSAVIAAAGSSVRMGENKLLMEILSIPVLVHSIRAFQNNDDISEIIVVCRENDIVEYTKLIKQFSLDKVRKIVIGGDTRAKSVLNALYECTHKLVAIHDGARPLVSDEIISNTINLAKKTNAAAPAIAVKDSIKKVENGVMIENINRNDIVCIQTPQVFDLDLIKAAITNAKDMDITDDASALEILGQHTSISEGSYKNIKITTQEDIIFAESIYHNARLK